MQIPALTSDELRWAEGVWRLLELLGDKDRLPTCAVPGPRFVRRVLHAKFMVLGRNSKPFYYFTEANKARVRSWFAPDGRLKDAESFALALQEVRDKDAAKAEARKMRDVRASKYPRRRQPVVPPPGHRDMLSAFRAKALGYED
jgi:hypothetical protein